MCLSFKEYLYCGKSTAKSSKVLQPTFESSQCLINMIDKEICYITCQSSNNSLSSSNNVLLETIPLYRFLDHVTRKIQINGRLDKWIMRKHFILDKNWYQMVLSEVGRIEMLLRVPNVPIIDMLSRKFINIIFAVMLTYWCLYGLSCLQWQLNNKGEKMFATTTSWTLRNLYINMLYSCKAFSLNGWIPISMLTEDIHLIYIWRQ